jgi:hypothetical protein
MKLNPLVKCIIKADAEYFRRRQFTSAAQYREVIEWLNNPSYQDGEDDHWVRQEIAAWLRSDITYWNSIEPSATRYFWYIAPIFKFGSWLIKRLLRRSADYIEKGI